jgi:hypothetical protein
LLLESIEEWLVFESLDDFELDEESLFIFISSVGLFLLELSSTMSSKLSSFKYLSSSDPEGLWPLISGEAISLISELVISLISGLVISLISESDLLFFSDSIALKSMSLSSLSECFDELFEVLESFEEGEEWLDSFLTGTGSFR